MPRLPRYAALPFLVLALALPLSACSGDDPTDTPSTSAPGSGDPQAGAGGETTGATTAPPAAPVTPVTQPPLPADPADYTPAYVEQTLDALFQDYRAALVALKTSGSVDDEVRALMADVYHPEVYDIQVRNLEDYYGDGAAVADEPGEVQVAVTGLHSVTADCILAVTTYDVQALTQLEAPAEDGFFIGLRRNPDAADTTRPWLVTVEYTTSDGVPLPEDVCS